MKTDPPLDTFQSAEFLTEMGRPIAPTTLALRRVRGGGPVFHRFGHKVFYKKTDLIEWAENRTSKPLTRTKSGV